MRSVAVFGLAAAGWAAMVLAAPASAAALPAHEAAAASSGCSGTSQACLIVELPNHGGTEQFTQAQVAAASDVLLAQYTEHSSPSGSTQVTVTGGLSIDKLLASLDPAIDPASLSFATVSVPGGVWATLSAADLASHNDFVDQQPPVFYTSGTGLLTYLRAQRTTSSGGTDTKDDNNLDRRDSSKDGALVVALHDSPELKVRATVDHRHVRPGTEVTFTGHVANESTPGPPDYDWQFSDGTALTGVQVRRTYPTATCSTALLTVSDTGDDATGQAVVPSVDVGHKCEADTSTGKTGKTGQTGKTGGHHSAGGQHPGQGGGGPGTGGTGPGGPELGGVPLPSLPPGNGSTTLTPRQLDALAPQVDEPPIVSGQLLTGDVTSVNPRTGDALAAGAASATSSGEVAAEVGGGVAAVVFLLGLGAAAEGGWSPRRIFATIRR